jgi:hypothetical protein
MITTFRAEGPFTIWRPQGRILIDESAMRFWTDHPEFADEVGCYICAIRAGRGYVPIYVGQATVGFRKECFDHHKLDHYNKARDIRDKKGTPVLFLIVRESGAHGRTLGTCLTFIENFLIQLAADRNAALENVERVEWRIQGVFRSGEGQPSHSARHLQRLLGLAGALPRGRPSTSLVADAASRPHGAPDPSCSSES